MNINSSDKKALETISNIIYSRQKDGQLDDSNLSKGEIFLIKRAFLNVWKRIRHRRIQYPTSKNNTFSCLYLNNLWPNTSSMFRITPIQEGHDTK